MRQKVVLLTIDSWQMNINADHVLFVKKIVTIVPSTLNYTLRCVGLSHVIPIKFIPFSHKKFKVYNIFCKALYTYVPLQVFVMICLLSKKWLFRHHLWL